MPDRRCAESGPLAPIPHLCSIDADQHSRPNPGCPFSRPARAGRRRDGAEPPGRSGGSASSRLLATSKSASCARIRGSWQGPPVAHRAARTVPAEREVPVPGTRLESPVEARRSAFTAEDHRHCELAGTGRRLPGGGVGVMVVCTTRGQFSGQRAQAAQLRLASRDHASCP